MGIYRVNIWYITTGVFRRYINSSQIYVFFFCSLWIDFTPFFIDFFTNMLIPPEWRLALLCFFLLLEDIRLNSGKHIFWPALVPSFYNTDYIIYIYKKIYISVKSCRFQIINYLEFSRILFDIQTRDPYVTLFKYLNIKCYQYS